MYTRKKSNATNVILKLGEEGLLLYFIDQDFTGYQTDKLSALNSAPQDVAGAGDSLLALMATGLSSNQNMLETAAAACCMSSLAVQNMGNLPISSESLKNYLSEILY